jgi:hypothetical protein
MPAVISEIVANAWDADACNVCIEIDLKNPRIIITDDGCGMSEHDINNRFLKVGYRKRDEVSRTAVHKRIVMARKDIGKLSLFSIAHEITILSCKDGEKNALKINTRDLDAAIRKGDNYSPQELDESLVCLAGNGTKLILEDLKKRTLQLEPFLKRRLARRFSVIGDKNNFSVFINGVKLLPEDRDYLPKSQYLWIYGSEEESNLLLAQVNKNVFKQSFIRDGRFVSNGIDYCVSGWLATTDEPIALKGQDEAINRISVMVRGKMAKEDILSECAELGMHSKYVFGEISAEFLDRDDEEDIIVSNRQSFFEDDLKYLALKDFLGSELKAIRSIWIDLRNDFGTKEAVKFTVVKKWYDSLSSLERHSAKSLFGKISQLDLDFSQKRELIGHGILAFETLKLKDCIERLDEISPDGISVFLDAAHILSSLEAAHYYKIINERLLVIDKLRQIVDADALEKKVQEHLADNLWLLDPSWERSVGSILYVEKTIKLQFDVINKGLTQEERDARLDIRYLKTANKHIVIELKRSKRKVSSKDLLDQVRKYYDALQKIMDLNHEWVEIVVIMGEPPDNLDKTGRAYNNLLQMLAVCSARILYYNELISNAEHMYRDFLEKNQYLAQFYDSLVLNNETTLNAF